MTTLNKEAEAELKQAIGRLGEKRDEPGELQEVISSLKDKAPQLAIRTLNHNRNCPVCKLNEFCQEGLKLHAIYILAAYLNNPLKRIGTVETNQELVGMVFSYLHANRISVQELLNV